MINGFWPWRNSVEYRPWNIRRPPSPHHPRSLRYYISWTWVDSCIGAYNREIVYLSLKRQYCLTFQFTIMINVNFLLCLPLDFSGFSDLKNDKYIDLSMHDSLPNYNKSDQLLLFLCDCLVRCQKFSRWLMIDTGTLPTIYRTRRLCLSTPSLFIPLENIGTRSGQEVG